MFIGETELAFRTVSFSNGAKVSLEQARNMILDELKLFTARVSYLPARSTASLRGGYEDI